MTEVDLCDRLRDWAERLGFEVYPEVNGWDLVLVATEPRVLGSLRSAREGQTLGPNTVPAGYQVGIHAKLRANCDVLMQAAAGAPKWSYPQLPFVAVPQAGEGFQFVAYRLGVGVIETEPHARRQRRWGQESGPRDPVIREWPTPHTGHPPLKLPPIASRAIVAGAPSPRVLSEWRVSAIRFLIWARTADVFTIYDLDRFGISRTWADRWGELVETVTEQRRGRPIRVRRFRLTTKADRLPDAGYRDVAEELARAEAGKGAA